MSGICAAAKPECGTGDVLLVAATVASQSLASVPGTGQWLMDAARQRAVAVPTIVAVLLGCGIGLLWPALPPWLWLWLVLPTALLLAFQAPRWRLPAAALAGMAWALLHAALVLDAQWPQARDGQQLLVQGKVVSLPLVQPGRTRFQLRVDDVPWLPAEVRGRLLDLTWHDHHDGSPDTRRDELAAAQHWQLLVRLRRPSTLLNPGGFDAARHALSQRVHATGLVQSAAPQWQLRQGGGLQRWRQRLSARIAAQLPSSQSGFIRALALGDTGGLVEDDWQRLRASGLTHLVAISGFHVGMLGAVAASLTHLLWRWLPGLARRWPRPQAMAVAALLGSALYACAAGLGLPAVRTVLMIAVVVLARGGRRVVGLAQCLALALLAVLVCDPLALLAAGFWLSFAGVAWLAWSLPNGALSPLRGLLAAQGVATLGLLPLTVLLFGQASLLGPLANLLAIPWWSLVVVPLCVLGVLLEALWPGAGIWAWQAAGMAFAPSWTLFSWLADSPLALWWLPESGLLAAMLALLAAACWLLPAALPGKGLACLLWLPLLWPQRSLPLPPDGVELHLLDVGQGLAVLVRTRRHTLLYDAGPRLRGGFDAGQRVVVPALHALGVRRLDMLMLSHGDADHAGGMAAVRAAFAVKQLRTPPGMGEVAATDCLRGQRWNWDGVDFEVLHPPLHFPYLGNESSCVLRIRNAHGAILLTGDIGQVVERQLLAADAPRLRADVVLAPHHGSAGSSQAALVRATGARLVLVSAGRGNRFGHPDALVVRRWRHAGAEVLGTADSGALRVWLDARGLAVRERRSWRKRLWHGAG